MKTEDATAYIQTVDPVTVARYARYFRHILPRSPEDTFRRWLFTYASVHTTWRLNCRMYQALEDLEWLGDKDELHRKITAVGAGFQNKRANYIHQFSEFFFRHSDWFTKSAYETWRAYRARVQKAALGIGQAKAAFLVELTYPLDAEVVCTDTHILQLYGYTPKQINERGISMKKMVAVEDHWVSQCADAGIPPVIGRWNFWDRKQGQSDSRYWSFVLERENYNDRLAQVARAQGA